MARRQNREIIVNYLDTYAVLSVRICERMRCIRCMTYSHRLQVALAEYRSQS